MGTDTLAAYLGIDVIDEAVQANLVLAKSAAERYLQGAVSDALDLDDPRASELLCIIAADFYGNRSYMESGKVGAAVRRLVGDMLMQLRMEGRGDGEG